MNIKRYQPLSLLHDLHDEINHIFDSDVVGNSKGVFHAKWNPHVDIKEDKESYKVIADIPGIDPKDIKVTVENSTLMIEGERYTESQDKKNKYSRIERFSGSFYRQFNLPVNINSENIIAKSRHGVLELTIPKKEKPNAKFIKVEQN